MEQLRKLKKQRIIRRSIEGAVTVFALAALLVFLALKEKGKIVTTTQITPFLSYDTVTYTNEYSVGILLFGLVFALFAAFLLADLLLTRICYTEIDGEDVIIYNGLGHIKLSVNGEERDSMFFKGYLETKLKSGVTVVVSPQFFLSYHVTFSDNRPAIDL